MRRKEKNITRYQMLIESLLDVRPIGMRQQRPTNRYLRYLLNEGTWSEWLQYIIRGSMTWGYRGLIVFAVFQVVGPYLGLITYISTKLFMAYGGLAFLTISLLDRFGIYHPPVWLSMFRDFTTPLRWIGGVIDAVEWFSEK